MRRWQEKMIDFCIIMIIHGNEVQTREIKYRTFPSQKKVFPETLDEFGVKKKKKPKPATQGVFALTHSIIKL